MLTTLETVGCDFTLFNFFILDIFTYFGQNIVGPPSSIQASLET